MLEWQSAIDLAVVVLAGVLGWAGGRRAVRKRVAGLLGNLVVEELAKVLAPLLAPLLAKLLRPALMADTTAALEQHAKVQREELSALVGKLGERVARVEGSVEVLTEQSRQQHN